MSVGRCQIEGCERVEQLRRGMCNLHRMRARAHGDPTKLTNRARGEGTRHIDGYWMFERDGRAVLRHVLIAETAIGKRLPKGAEVHHVDRNRANDANTNLVICPSAAYHQLLHRRTEAYEACGHADWIRCSLCKQYDQPSKIKVYKPSGNKWHPECRRANPARRRHP
jgi:hypothetical protein